MHCLEVINHLNDEHHKLYLLKEEQRQAVAALAAARKQNYDPVQNAVGATYAATFKSTVAN